MIHDTIDTALLVVLVVLECAFYYNQHIKKRSYKKRTPRFIPKLIKSRRNE